MTSNYEPTASDMVRQIQSNIQSYGDNGPIRALAQEPVQNSLDARYNSPIVRVEYRLHERRDSDGRPYFLLTVTDSGTHGLRGAALTPAQLQARGYVLDDDENWAAFEGQGFTKSDRASLGSRGQGKSAFLYHSNPPGALRGRRMMMLYDTRLADGLYRMGVRNANPVDTIQTPPWHSDKAEQIIRDQLTDATGINIDLRLHPLGKAGTRVIVPYLSEDAVTAIRDGELMRWLQRCWWRAIQTKTLEIVVADDATGDWETISVPTWWQDEPWIGEPPAGVEVKNREDIDIGDRLRIKRIVLLYDEGLESSDAYGNDAQFEGIQLLRGQQWITTIGSGDRELSRFVPRQNRTGLRGFVEFDQSLDKVLRDLETPQHHKFDRMQGIVRAIYREVEGTVEEFATELGWRQERESDRRPEQQPDIARDILQWFAPNARGPRPMPTSEQWECQLSFSLPDPKVARVDWGQILENVKVLVTSSSSFPTNATVSVNARHAEEPLEVSVWEPEVISFFERDGELEIGRLQVVRDATRPDQIKLPLEGKWSLTARVRHNGRVVARATRAIYVHQAPPEPNANPLALSISAVNRNHPEERRIGRINYGDQVAVQITARNNTSNSVGADLTASVQGVNPMLADGDLRVLRGTPEGDTSDRQAVWSGDIIFCEPNKMPLPTDDTVYIAVEPGRRSINADLLANNDQIGPASASYSLLIETDPRTPDWLPFRLQERNEDLPRWKLEEITGELLLLFPTNYATHRELASADEDESHRKRRRDAFLLEITCEALMQWALEPAWHNGDRTRLDELCTGEPHNVESAKWERFVEMMEQLERAGRGHPEVPLNSLAQDFRECAAHMMRLYEESH